MKSHPTDQNPPNSLNLQEKLFLNLHEAARFLDISMSLMYKLSSKNAITKYKRGGKIYFKPEDLIGYIEKGKIEGVDEIRGKVNQILVQQSQKSKGVKE